MCMCRLLTDLNMVYSLLTTDTGTVWYLWSQCHVKTPASISTPTKVPSYKLLYWLVSYLSKMTLAFRDEKEKKSMKSRPQKPGFETDSNH